MSISKVLLDADRLASFREFSQFENFKNSSAILSKIKNPKNTLRPTNPFLKRFLVLAKLTFIPIIVQQVSFLGSLEYNKSCIFNF